MPLQRTTTRVCHALLWIPTLSGPACSAEVSRTKWPLLHHVVKACRTTCILERQREHIGSIWSRVTCLALPLAAAQSLARRALGDSRSLRRLTVAIGNKQHK
jgi:hypothetical protein